MARAGVNYVDVVKAAESVRATRLQPTVDRVRERLGTGSRSTIAPLLKRWRNESDDTDEVTAGLPSDLLQLVKSLNERVHAAADLKVEEALKSFRDTENALKMELQTLRETLKTQDGARKEDNQRAQAGAEKIERLEQALSESRASSAKFELLHQESSSRVDELKGTIRELKDENRDIREHFEHYQSRTAEDRHQERAQHQYSVQLLEDQIHALKDKLAQSDILVSKLDSQCLSNQDEIDKLKVKKQTLELELKNMKSLGVKYDTVVTLNSELDQKLTELNKKLSELRMFQSENKTEISFLTESITKSKAELQSYKNSIRILTDKYELLIEEKAVIQGKFEQLQQSL